jgi:signal transduction histidine kinase
MMNIFKRRSLLLVSASLLLLLGVVTFYVSHILKNDFIKEELKNQKKIAKTIEQSLNLFFRTLVFITESTASNKAYDFEKNMSEDKVRFNEIGKNDLLKGFNVLENKSNHSALWQVYKGLPDFHEGNAIGMGRREVARNILANNPELHYVFEMDINGDLVFLEPYTTQVGITSFNYGFRDYLKLSKHYKKTVISEGYLSHDKAKTQILTVATPIFDSRGEIKRVFAVSISSKAIKEKIFLALKDTIEGLDDGHLILIDRHGHSIASSSSGMIYSPIVNNVSDENDVGNLRGLDLLKKINWNEDVFEKGNLWERSTKSWDLMSLKETYSGLFNFKSSEQLGTLYPISVLNNEKLWGIIVSSSYAKIESRIFILLRNVLFIWLLLSVVTLTVTINLIKRNEKLEQKLLQDKKAIEDLNAQVAHDIRSPAAVVKRILEKEELGEEDKAHLSALVKRIVDISNQILGLKNLQEIKTRSVSDIVNEIIREKSVQFENFPKVILNSKVLISKNSKINFSDSEVSRILSNLINNSFEALLDYEGTIEIVVLSKGHSVEFSVKDNGVGISQENLMALNSGFTSKTIGKGIGLRTAKEKVLKAGGEFNISSEVGFGTEIRFCLPIFDEAKSQTTVLLDDDKYIRLNWEKEFKECGLELVSYSSPKKLIDDLHLFDSKTTFVLDTCDFSADFIQLLDRMKNFEQSKVFIYSGYERKTFIDRNITIKNIIPKDYDLKLISQNVMSL